MSLYQSVCVSMLRGEVVLINGGLSLRNQITHFAYILDSFCWKPKNILKAVILGKYSLDFLIFLLIFIKDY